MPYTKKQINRIIAYKGQPVIDLLANVPMSQRVTESLIRRKLYALEDRAVLDLARLWKTAYSDFQRIAVSTAAQYGISALNSDIQTIRWRGAFTARIKPRIEQLKIETTERALRTAMQMYMLGYYGRAWALDMMTTGDVKPEMPMPNAREMTARVLQPKLQEAYAPDDVIYDLLGQDWKDQYAGNIDTLVNKISGSLSGSVAQNLGIPQAARKLADVMGITDGTSGIFGKINTLTRSYVMGASNSGALDLYRANSDILQGVTWLASKDGRVCTQCLRLNGTTWAFNDPFRLTPPYDSHPNCRCTLLPAFMPQYEQYLLPVGAPPALTWGEWAGTMGLSWLLSDLLIDNEMDSSLVGEIDYDEDMWDRMDV